MTPVAFVVLQADGDMAIEPDPQGDWRMPFLDYLIHKVLPTNKIEEGQLAR